jgi:hypothetical protein
VASEPSAAGLSDMNVDVDLDVKILSFGNRNLNEPPYSTLKNLLF